MVHITPPKLAALKLFDCLAAWLLVIFWILNALRWGGKRHGVHLQVQSQWRTLGSVRSSKTSGVCMDPECFQRIWRIWWWSCLVGIIWCPFHSFTEISPVDLYLKSMSFGIFFIAVFWGKRWECPLPLPPCWNAKMVGDPSFSAATFTSLRTLSQKWMISWNFSWIFAQLFAFTC